MEERLNMLEDENNELRQKLPSLIESPNLTTPESPPAKEKVAVLAGNDIKKIHHHLKDYLQCETSLILHESNSTSSHQLLAETCDVIQTLKDKEVSVFFHPGVVECEINKSEDVIPAITKFCDWVVTSSPTTRLHVISVPQVIKKDCEKVNQHLSELSASEKISYIELTRVQSDLLRRDEHHYAADTAHNIAKVLSRHVSRSLGVTAKRPKPKSASQVQSQEAHGAKDVEKNSGIRPEAGNDITGANHGRRQQQFKRAPYTRSSTPRRPKVTNSFRNNGQAAAGNGQMDFLKFLGQAVQSFTQSTASYGRRRNTPPSVKHNTGKQGGFYGRGQAPPWVPGNC